MRFGLYLLNHGHPGTRPGDLFEDVRAQTVAARELGFDLVTTGQHYLADYAYLQPLTLLSRLAAVTGEMTVGSGVVLLPLHHPVQIAEDVATLAAFADDVVLGVGAGYRDVEYRSFGVPKSERASRMAEGVELLSRLLADEAVSYDGTHYSVSDATVHARPDRRVPIWVAGHSPPAVARAARLGDAWLVGPHSTRTEAAELKRAHYEPNRTETDRDASVPIIRETFVAPTTDEAVAAAGDHLAARYDQYVEWDQNEAMADETELAQPFEALARERFLVGTPAEVCADLERYVEELDPSHVVCRTQWPGLAHERAMDSLQLLGDEVIPNV